jgi:hypothetical protein
LRWEILQKTGLREHIPETGENEKHYWEEKMKKYLLLILTGLQVSNTASSQSAIDPRLFELPDSVMAINNPEDLAPYLNSADLAPRVWGMIRLGEIGTASDIPRLVEMYNNEPYRGKKGLHGPGPGVKFLAIEAIGDIGGEQAERVLLDLVDSFESTRNSDSLTTFSAICIALGRVGTPAAFTKLQKLYSNRDLKHSIRSLALAGTYTYTLKEAGYSSTADSVDFLFEIMRNNYSWGDPNKERRIITDAVMQALMEINSPAIRSVLESRIAGISDNGDLKTLLERTLGTMERALNVE